MHDQNWSQFERAIDPMSDDEKRDLIRRVEGSLDRNGGSARSHGPETAAETLKRQKRAWEEVLRAAAGLAERELHDGLVASRDHDKILHGSFPG